MKVLLAAMTLALAACSSIGSVANLPNVVAPSAAGGAATSGAPWSEEFAEGFCAALKQHATLEQQIEPLLTALEGRDFKAIARHAAAVGKTVRAVDARLKAIASLYKPARPLLIAWRKANASLIKALKEMERGARNSNWTSVERSAVHLAEGAKLLDKAVPLVQEFAAKRPFLCA